MLTCQRKLFAIPKDVIYLNSASYSPLTKHAYKQGLKGLKRKLSPWTVDPESFPIETDELRTLFGTLVGASSDEIAIINSTAYGIEIAARNLPLKRMGQIILLEDQFPSNVLSWRRLAKNTNTTIKFIKRPVNFDWTSQILENINNSVSIVSLPPCHWFDGSRIDLEMIAERCRQVEAALVVDATQAIGALPFDVKKVQPDFLTCSAYKWLLGPYTLAFLYAAPHRRKGVPLELHRWNHYSTGPDITPYSYNKELPLNARRYDMGEVNNFLTMPIAIESLKKIVEWGPHSVREYIDPMVNEVSKKAEERGWSCPKKEYRVSHFIGIKPKAPFPKKITALLQNQNVYISQRGKGIRVSPHVFNNSENIKNFFDILDQVLADTR